MGDVGLRYKCFKVESGWQGWVTPINFSYEWAGGVNIPKEA
jgi:hypothetical protein